MKQQFKQAVFMPKDAALCIHFTDIQNLFNFRYGVCWDSFWKKVTAQGITSLFVAQCRASTKMKKTGLAVTRFICSKSSSQISRLPLTSTPFQGKKVNKPPPLLLWKALGRELIPEVHVHHVWSWVVLTMKLQTSELLSVCNVTFEL